MSSIDVEAFMQLARRAHFSKELEQKLLKKGYVQEEIAPLLEDLRRRRWLDDKELAQRFVARLRQKGYGARVIAQRLVQKAGDVPIPIVDGDILLLIEKKYRHKLPRDRRNVVAALLRRGFSYAAIDEALQSVVEPGAPCR